MGRLIDADKLKNIFLKSRSKVFDYRIVIQEIAYAPTVEAIPKADYETRLNADLLVILEELDLQIDESAAYNLEVAKVQRLIRDRIDKLKESKEWKKCL